MLRRALFTASRRTAAWVGSPLGLSEATRAGKAGAPPPLQPRRSVHALFLFAGARGLRGALVKHHDRSHVAGALALLAGAGAAYLLYHVERAPVSARRRLMLATSSDFAEIADMIDDAEGDQRAEFLKDGYDFARDDDPRVKRIERITRALIEANAELRALDVHWNFTVLTKKRPEGARVRDVNAAVMLHGSVYVWDSMLDLMKTDSELAVVLGHELAHVACAHTIEAASVHYALRQTAIVCLGLVGLDGFSSATAASLARALVSSAHSRTCETEADFVGLEFMRRLAEFDGRYDERAALSAWAAMLETEKGVTSITPAWTHSHPQTENRMHNFEHWLAVGDLRTYAAQRNGNVWVKAPPRPAPPHADA